MASILFLDDCPTRRKWAEREWGPGNLYEAVEDAASAIERLGSKHYDLVFLDHDLGGTTWQDVREKNSGSEVVRWIVANKPSIEKIVVHSMNFPAANRMTDDLQRAGYDAEYRSWMQLIREMETA